MTCPRCHSHDVETVDYMNIECLVCRECGYDEREEYEIVPESAQREKGRNPYRQGGARRSHKDFLR